MKNFPSALIKQQSTKNGLGSDASSTLKNIASQAMSNIFGNSSQTSTKNTDKNFARGYERPELETLVDEFNILEDKDSTKQIQDKVNSQIGLKYNTQNGLPKKSNTVNFEDPFKFSSSIFSVINNYQYVLGTSLPNLYEVGNFEYNKDKITKVQFGIVENIIAPSLFNPYAGVSVIGFTENIPLIDREIDDKLNIDIERGDDKLKVDKQKELKLTNSLWNTRKDLSDCSIQKLVELSQGEVPELGLATYRYIDFMYCKDLGKIPNNRLITLRKFPAPVGDNIFKESHPKNSSEFTKKVMKGLPDIGRLITWFDNEDNKLEDICKYQYHASWKEFTSEIQQQARTERDDGLVTKLANFCSPQNNKMVLDGFSGNTGLLSMGASFFGLSPSLTDKVDQPYYGLETLTNYDKNRIYEPQDKIWSTHKYEGRLEFSQEITLTFRYQLRSYSNINPRAAMLDLIGNIQAVTYRRGSFWGGEIKMYGPQANNSIFAKADAWIDKGFDELGGIWARLKEGNFSIETIQGLIESAVNTAGQALEGAADTAKGYIPGSSEEARNTANDMAEKGGKKLDELNQKYKFTSAIKGMLKNQLGRPQIYALNSLLTGEEVGPWHLTIGNPRNPIMSIGNLILENSEVQHYGPLGIDDFPTELRVTVTLKHARPRDSVEIQKMYTKGMSSIYKPMNLINVQKYWKNDFAFADVITDGDILKKNLSSI